MINELPKLKSRDIFFFGQNEKTLENLGLPKNIRENQGIAGNSAQAVLQTNLLSG